MYRIVVNSSSFPYVSNSVFTHIVYSTHQKKPPIYCIVGKFSLSWILVRRDRQDKLSANYSRKDSGIFILIWKLALQIFNCFRWRFPIFYESFVAFPIFLAWVRHRLLKVFSKFSSQSSPSSSNPPTWFFLYIWIIYDRKCLDDFSFFWVSFQLKIFNRHSSLNV